MALPEIDDQYSDLIFPNKRPLNPPADYEPEGQRVYILGRTGSGKTTAGIWHLSLSDYKNMPWVVVDTKRDRLIKKLLENGAMEIDIEADPPNTPGIYVVRPDHRRASDLEAFLYRIWDYEGVGVFIDEGHQVHEMAPGALRSLLTQGRSKNIPMIVQSQRPAHIGKFTMSEADFYQVFDLIDDDDKKTIWKNTNIDLDEEKLEPHCSIWFQAINKKRFFFRPCPLVPTTIKGEKGIVKGLDTLKPRPVML